MAKKLRRVRWNRVLILIVAFMMCMSFAVTAMGEDSPEIRMTEQVVVTSGDTLWTLIKSYNPSYAGDMNKAIYDVKALNGLDESCIYVGQTLAIPVDYK